MRGPDSNPRPSDSPISLQGQSECTQAGWMLGCYSYSSWKHLRSYHDRYRLGTRNTHCDFIQLPPILNQATGKYPTQSHYLDTELTGGGRSYSLIRPHQQVLYRLIATASIYRKYIVLSYLGDWIAGNMTRYPIYSVTLSWHWANQFLPYPLHAQRQVR